MFYFDCEVRFMAGASVGRCSDTSICPHTSICPRWRLWTWPALVWSHTWGLCWRHRCPEGLYCTAARPPATLLHLTASHVVLYEISSCLATSATSATACWCLTWCNCVKVGSSVMMYCLAQLCVCLALFPSLTDLCTSCCQWKQLP